MQTLYVVRSCVRRAKVLKLVTNAIGMLMAAVLVMLGGEVRDPFVDNM